MSRPNVNAPIPSYEEAVVAPPPTTAPRRPSEPEAAEELPVDTVPPPMAIPATPPPELPPAYAVVDEKATTFTIYGTFNPYPERACLPDILPPRRTHQQASHTKVAVLYEAHDPPFVINEYYIQGRAGSTLPGALQLRFGLRRWHVVHMPTQGSRPIEIMTCGKPGGFTKALKQRKNELEPSQWKDSEGHVIATEVLKMGPGGKMPTIELRDDLDQTCRELVLALWVSRLWAAFGAGSGYVR
ncbi:unnamed protein product [Alternaria alternata]